VKTWHLFRMFFFSLPSPYCYSRHFLITLTTLFLCESIYSSLLEVSDALAKEKEKSANGSHEWVTKCKKLTEELDWFRDLTDKLTGENKKLVNENRRCKKNLKTQEEDREFLIKQLVSVKKENARLRYSFDQANFSEQEKQRIGLSDADIAPQLQLERESRSTGQLKSPGVLRIETASPQAAFSPARPRSAKSRTATINAKLGVPSSSSPRGGSAASDSRDARAQAIILKLQKQLEGQEKKYRQLRTAHTQELASRTVLQNFLRKCIEDVRQDIAERRKRERRGKGLPPAPVDPRTIPLEEFTPADRINVMEWLLSQDHVIYLLYEKMFPRNGNDLRPQAHGGGGSMEGAADPLVSPYAGGKVEQAADSPGSYSGSPEREMTASSSFPDFDQETS